MVGGVCVVITWDCINDVNVLVLIDWDLVGVQSLWFRILIVMSWGFYLADIDPIYGLLCGLVAYVWGGCAPLPFH